MQTFVTVFLLCTLIFGGILLIAGLPVWPAILGGLVAGKVIG